MLGIQNHRSYTLQRKSIPSLYNLEKGDEDFQMLMEPHSYIKLIPKKNSISLLFQSLNHWMKLPTDKAKALEEIFLDSYDYILVLDDILDDSELRRLLPAAHRIYGTKRTLLAMNAFLMLIMKRVADFNNPEVIEAFHNGLLKHYTGQNRELCWVINFKCPTIPEYYALTNQKTQSFFDVMEQMMKSMSQCKHDFSTLLKLYSQYFQFQNDYCMFKYEQYWKTKGFGDDITEGKFTLPIIHAVHSGTPEGKVVFNIVCQHTKDIDMKKHCIHLLNKLGSIEYARQVTADTEQQLRAEIDKLGGNDTFFKLIDKINLWKNDEFVDDA